MKECVFTPTAEEAQAIQAAMDHRHITRVSEYVRMAVMQVVRRELAAKSKARPMVETIVKKGAYVEHEFSASPSAT